MNPGLLFAAIALALAPVAAAQAADSPLDALFACQEISDDVARLACLDREVTALRGETKSGDIIAIDREQLEEDSYGLDPSSVPLPAPESKDVATAEPADSSTGEPAGSTAAEPAGSSAGQRTVRDEDGRIEGLDNLPVARLGETPKGRLVVKLQNGQVWQQIDNIRIFVPRRTPQEGMTVSIRNAALGSYKMQLNGDGPWFRARREN